MVIKTNTSILQYAQFIENNIATNYKCQNQILNVKIYNRADYVNVMQIFKCSHILRKVFNKTRFFSLFNRPIKSVPSKELR